MRRFGFGENDLRKQYSIPTPPDGGGFLDWIDRVDWIDCLTADRMDTFNKVNNVRCQSSQHGQPSQHCLKPNAPAAGGCSA